MCTLLGINLGDLKYLFFGLALVVLMIFRPQGLFPVRQQLLAYGKRRARSAAQRRRLEGGGMTRSRRDADDDRIDETGRPAPRGARRRG